MMSLQILTCVWGKTHLDMFKKAALRSLSWTKNKESLIKYDAKWNIFTDDDDVESLLSYCKEALPSVNFNVKPTSLLRNYIDPIQSATIWQIDECFKASDKLLLVAPDVIFGDGSIEGLWACAQDKDSVVVSPHPRVLSSIIDEITNVPLSNAELVTLSWQHLHESWVHGEKGHINQSTYMGGIEWTAYDNLIFGKHMLPSPYLIQFTEEDLRYFKKAGSFGNFDWRWPGDILVGRQRQRYVASSDLVFFVEITDSEKNIPPIYENSPRTGFHRNDPHNHQNAQVVFTFRKG